MSVFSQHRPSRVRVETDTAGANVDAIVTCYLILYPTPDGATINMSSQTQNGAQLAELVAAAIRYAQSAGVMGQVFATLLASPSQLDIAVHPPKPPGTPPDDLPPHLRGGRG